MKRFNRLTVGFSKKLGNLEAAVAMFVCAYNYCWRPREKGKSGRLNITPVMAAGLIEHLLSFEELFRLVMGYENIDKRTLQRLGCFHLALKGIAFVSLI